jgi:hypothetical protein
VTCGLLKIPVSCVDPDGSVNGGKNDDNNNNNNNNLFQYCDMTNFTYNSSRHYILLRECIYSVFMLIHF